jgi:RNA polymerase sigma factor (sigma-70 family)
MRNELFDLYENNRGKLLLSAYKILDDYHVAADVVQDAWLRLNEEDYSKISGYATQWLFTVVRNSSLKILKRRKKTTLVHNEEFFEICKVEEVSPFDDLVKKENIKKLIKSFHVLNKTQKKVLECRFYKNLSYIEISKKLNLTVSNVGVIINTIVKKLRLEFKKLEEYESVLAMR